MAQQVVTQQETLVREFFHKVFHEGNLDAADDYAAADIEHHLLHKRIIGLKEWKEMAKAVTAAFPDVRYDLEDFVVEGDKLAFRWEGKGSHQGELWGIQPTNKQIIWHGITLIHLRDNKVQQAWTYSNFAELFGSLSL